MSEVMNVGVMNVGQSDFIDQYLKVFITDCYRARASRVCERLFTGLTIKACRAPTWPHGNASFGQRLLV